MSPDPTFSRRDFLKHTAAGAAAAGLAAGTEEPADAGPAALGKSKVVVVTNPAIGAPGKMDQKAVTAAVHKAVCTLFGTEDDVAKAFGRVASAKDIVALKPNAAGGHRNNGTHREVVNGIIFGLQKAGVKNSQMIAYEQDERLLRQSGYPILRDPKNIRVLGIDQRRGFAAKEWTYGSHKTTQRLAKIVADECDVLINVPFLKTANAGGQGMGVSLALKNHQGSISHPKANHAPGGAPHIAELNMLPPIRQKTKLIVCDATYPLYDGGPGDNPVAHWEFNAILAATDPVALDAVGYDILERKRKEFGFPPIEPVPAYIEVADMRRLGNGKLQNIERIDVEV